MSKKWLIGILVVSVMLNVAFIGVFVGQRINHGFGGPHATGAPPFGIFRWTRTLDDARRAELADDLATYRRAVRGNFRAMRQAQNRFREAMLQEPMNTQQVRAALDTLHGAMQSQQSAGHDGLIAVLEQLSIEERRELDKHLRKQRRGEPRPERRPQ